jgi:hypothetical protein
MALRRTIGLGRVVVERRGGVRDRVDALDGLVECAVLSDVLYNDKLKALAVFRELFFEKCAPG